MWKPDRWRLFFYKPDRYQTQRAAKRTTCEETHLNTSLLKTIQRWIWRWCCVVKGKLNGELSVFSRRRWSIPAERVRGGESARRASATLPGASAGASVPSNAQSDPVGHSADRGGTGPYRSADRAHSAPAPWHLRPGLRTFWKKDQRVCNLHDGLWIWRPNPVPPLHAHLSRGLHWHLADALLHLPFLYGACWCCSAVFLRDKLRVPAHTEGHAAESRQPRALNCWGN